MQSVQGWSLAILTLSVFFSGFDTPGLAEPAGDAGAAPLITGLSPASGRTGTLVIISGSNLVEVTGITFSKNAPAPLYGSMDDGTAIQTEVPADAVSGPVTVTTVHGTAISSSPFEVADVLPIIESFSPTSGAVGTWVHFSGIGLEGVTSVQFHGKEAVFTEQPWYLGGLRARVPSGAGTGPITITTKTGSHTTPASFTVLQLGAPAISEFSPRSGPPGTLIAIRGSFLVSVRSVTINGVAAEFSQMVADWLYVTVPVHATSGTILVVTESGSATTSTPFEVTQAQRPTITTVSPPSARSHSWVTITGAGLDFVEGVTFSGVPARYTVMASTMVIAEVPYAPSGPLHVICQTGVAISPEPFSVVGGPKPPVVLGFAPLSAVPGTFVTIQATNFGRVRSVLFDGKRAQFDVDGDEIQALVPLFATSGPITLETDYGPATSAQLIQIYNSGELDLFTSVSRNPIMLGDRTTFNIGVTNVGNTTLSGVVLTNTFACGLPDEVLSWDGNTPFFADPAAPELVAVIRATSTTGTILSTHEAVVCRFDHLEPGQSAVVQIEAEPHVPDLVCLLSVANTDEQDRPPVFSGFIATALVLGTVQLQIRHLGTDEVEISWPITDPPLILQSASRAERMADWTDVEQPVTVTEHCSARIPASSSGARFFRLVQR
ncbi:MAG: IPT/TIG domain-containing protein [Verrucomicrobiia bacterium]